MVEMQESARQEVLNKLASYVKSKLPAEKAKKVIALIPYYYRTIPLEDIAERPLEDLYGIILCHFNLMEQRTPDQCKLRVYNPNFASDGWQSTHTIIDMSFADMPFLVDSMCMEINRLGFTTHLIVSCGGIKTRRDKEGKLIEILPHDADGKDVSMEALAHLEINRETDTKLIENLRENLLRVLHDVSLVVEDWNKMREQLFRSLDELEQLEQANHKQLDREEIEESKTFLRWLVNDRFTFLGYRAYEVMGEGDEQALHLLPHTGLGVLRNESRSKSIRYFHELPPEARKLLLGKNILIIFKTNTESTVHRKAYTDYIGVKRFDAQGKFIGENRFIGLYTSEAYNSDPQNIPFLRHKVEKVLQKSDLPRSGHGARALRNILATLPRDDLFQATDKELYELSMGILHLQERRQIRLFIRKDAYDRYFSCLVYVPRENFNTELLYRMRDILKEALQGTEVIFETQFSQSALARIHFEVRVDPKKKIDYSIKEIEKKLVEVGRSWYDDLRENLLEHFGEERGNDLMSRYARAFPAGYRETFSPREAIFDIEYIERLRSAADLEMSFYHPADAVASALRFKLFHLESTIPLSDALPMLENMGLRVIGEQPYQIIFANGSSVWINDFTMEYALGAQLSAEENKDIFQNAFYKIWQGQIENDGFNRLVLKAHLDWHKVSMFRAYAKYLKQIGFTFSQQYIEETLMANANVAVLLAKLFKLRFDPAQQAQNTVEAMLHLENEIKNALDLVLNLDQDRILRRILEIIKATLRTNFFQKDALGNPKQYLSFKLDPAAISDLPLPLPKYEIFIYSPRFEGIHLRAGKVARGGIRWSDRREDFRTEVLGLMKAQQVKNALIVPAGAKGGFVTKMLPADGNRDAVMEETIACYKNYVRGLLDITDNLIGTDLVHPHDTVFYDEADPYLVVAADKGTATFSDIANSISMEYNFWLGDAFASGGSTGYDHKKMAITSRGAWESVKHHFQLLAIDIQNNPFSVVGIGDMSGDVFGNGMLLSQNIKLIAAFNHMHIFIDPTPDPKLSYAERKRLFNLPRSSWEDYNRELISQGGGIFKRSAKSIALSPEAQVALDLNKASVEPNELIRAILKAPVDLLWNGGIGTYVKASTETDLEARDRANDAIRINGDELRCKVVAEGGNLGCTQLGRIEYELRGGKINTDFVDNSGGVDCSDHEVNIKILLNDVVAIGDMTEKNRNVLLAEMTEEVAQLVLKDNYRQVRTITRAVSQSFDYLSLYMRFIPDQDRTGKINRKIEFLPDNKTLLERKAAGKGLTRPEIAVLMSYSKIIIKDDMLKSDLIEDPYLARYIVTAFPALLQQKFSNQMQHHRLRREIIATQLSNELVNEMGIGFVYQMKDETSATTGVIVQAYVIMRCVFDIPQLINAVDLLEQKRNADSQLEMLQLEIMVEAMRLIRRSVRWLLRNRRPPYDIAATIDYFNTYVRDLYQHLPQLLVGVQKENFIAKQQKLIADGVSSDIATRVASGRYIYSALNIVEIAKEKNADIFEVATIYFVLADRLELVWFREQINAYPVDTHWTVLARSSFKAELDIQQREITISVLQSKVKGKDVNAIIDSWFEKHQHLLQRWQAVLTQLHSTTVIDAAMLTVAIRELSELAMVSAK